jgi:hypothetical protein
MQKRRGPPASILPVTQADASRNGSSSKGFRLFGNGNGNSSGNGNGKGPIRRRKGTDGATNDLWGFYKLLLGIIATGLVVVLLQRHVMVEDRIEGMKLHNALQTDSWTSAGSVGEDDAPTEKPLDQFPSLQYALQNSKLVGIYFGAAWCPMTTPVTELLNQHFSELLLAPPSPGEETPSSPQAVRHEGLSIVYVSSDTDAEAAKDYLRPNWMTLPFATSERTDMKRHFLTCAKREMKDLGIKDRKHDIPTLIIVEGASQQVLTYHGVKDVNEYGAQAIDHWMELASLSDALDSKYRD